jgi:multidrug efflux pump subunit AcrB
MSFPWTQAISGFVFYSGMPPEQIETNIPYHHERMFILAGDIDPMESRSLPGVSLIKVYFVYFRVGADAAAAFISSLAMSDDLPPGSIRRSTFGFNRLMAVSVSAIISPSAWGYPANRPSLV